MASNDRELDLAAALGAEREASTQVLSLYIPNKNRHGRLIKTGRWIREAQEILTRIGEGYTTTPPHDGGCVSPASNQSQPIKGGRATVLRLR